MTYGNASVSQLLTNNVKGVIYDFLGAEDKLFFRDISPKSFKAADNFPSTMDLLDYFLNLSFQISLVS